MYCNSKKNHIIYKHTNKLNGKVYIGQTNSTLGRRSRPHGEGYKKCTLFWRAIQKYGWDNFSHDIIEENLTAEQANEREIYWIAYYNSYLDRTKGYNETPGGKNYLTDLWKDPTYRENMSKSFSIARLKVPKEERVKKAKYLASYAKKNWENAEWKENQIKNYFLGEKNPNCKKVQNLETGLIFNTIKEASLWCGLKSVSGIGQCCKGKQITCGKHPKTGERLHWQYVISEEAME